MARNSRRTKTNPLTVVGLFAGIGGLELGLQRAGHETIMLCESDPAANLVLDARFPEVEDRRDDVRERRSLPPETQLLAAGFPCQDLSQAGSGMGLRGKQSGLVEEVFHRLERKRVPWVLLENVPFMLWLERGRALRRILDGLEQLGYRWAYRVVDSRAFGLPQRRERVFILASTTGDPRSVLLSQDAGRVKIPQINGHPVAIGFYWTEGNRGMGIAVDCVPTLKGGSARGIPSPPAIWMPDGDIVTPDIRDAERMQGFPQNWTKPAEKIARSGVRWRLVGNSVTVRVAEWIGRRLRSPRRYEDAEDPKLGRSDRLPKAAWNLGNGRYAADVSSWPVAREVPPLTEFLKYPPAPLSARATGGFASRLQASSLRPPTGFLDALWSHHENMIEDPPDARSRSKH